MRTTLPEPYVGSAVTSGTTAPNYSLTGCGTDPVRVEFVMPAANACVASTVDYSALGGAVYGSSVQFVNGDSTNVNFALHYPDDYNTGAANVQVFVPNHRNGDPLPAGASGDGDWFYGFPYNSAGETTPPQRLNGRTIGATWGVAYSKQANRIFTSAFLKRHVGLGVLGSGGIYLLQPPDTSFNVTQFFDMDNNSFNTGANPTTRTRAATGTYGVGSSFNFASNTEVTFTGANDPVSGFPVGLGVIGTNVQRGLPTTLATANYDPAAFAQAGKVGMGDIDISDDGRFLFVMNLYQRKVFRLELNNPSNPTSVAAVTTIDLPSVSCNNGVLRPFGLKFYKNELYIGALCSGENGGVNNINGATDLQANVFKVANASSNSPGSASSILSYNLNYLKGRVRTIVPNTDRWYPWSDNAADRIKEPDQPNYMRPSPILSDIEFTERGDLVMAFTDRFGHQFGSDNRIFLRTDTTLGNGEIGGDALIAGVNCTTNSYSLESNGSITSINGAGFTGGAGNSQGPGGGEFYRGEYSDSPISPHPTLHDETSQGAVAQLKGSNHLYLTVMNPITWWSGGILRLSNTNGDQANQGYQLYRTFSCPNASCNTAGKANGLGDVELLTPLSPVEIGNRVWLDSNGNGIQDAGEPGIAGVTVELRNSGGTLLSTATTSAGGNYYFSSGPGTDTTSAKYNIAALVPNQQYVVRIPNAQGANKQAALGANGLVTANAGGGTPGTQADVRDSDGVLVGDHAEATVLASQIPTDGAVNHTFDFGFGTAALDYGDAPDTGPGTGVGNYNTVATNNGPSHVIVPNLRLGVVGPDADNGTLQNAAATADDLDNIDDEDGVATLPTILTSSSSVPLSVSVFNNTGSQATVACWIDFNRDGDFLDTGERASATVDSDASQQAVEVTFTGFDAPTAGESYLRCRIATDAGEVNSPKGAAGTGEVEDYPLTIIPPTSVTLLSFDVGPVDATTLRVEWSTASEENVLGFHLWRSETGDRSQAVRITAEMVEAEGMVSGAEYLFVDGQLQPDTQYQYWLQEIDANGTVTEYGPVTVRTPAEAGEEPDTHNRLFLPFLNR